MFCLIYVLLFLRQLPDRVWFSLEEGIARHPIRGLVLGASGPGGDGLVSFLNLCSVLTTTKSDRPGCVTPMYDVSSFT